MKAQKQIALLFILLLVMSCVNKRQPETTKAEEPEKTPYDNTIELNDTATTATPAEAEGITYINYVNQRYYYSVCYPDFLIPQGEAENGDGQKFLISDSSVYMLAYGALNLSESLRQDYIMATANNCYYESQYQITYKTSGDTWFVVNGMHENNMFYVHSVLNGGEIITLYFEYPVNEKQKYEAIVKQVVTSLTFTPKNIEED